MIEIVRWTHEYPNPFREGTDLHLLFNKGSTDCGSGTFLFGVEDLLEVKNRSQNLSWQELDETRIFGGFYVTSYEMIDESRGVGEFEFFDIINKVDLL